MIRIIQRSLRAVARVPQARCASTMKGLMQNKQMLISDFITFAAEHHPQVEVVSKTVEGTTHRYTYADQNVRCKQLCNVLKTIGVNAGDTVGTLAWNGYRHMELYYAVSGSGAVLHTINPRLFPEQIVYIVNHAADKVITFDLNLLPLIEKLAPLFKCVEKFIVMTDKAHMPKASAIPNLLCYEELMDAASSTFTWPSFDENSASSLCYTSGTTGMPKGVVYSHRSSVLHSYCAALPDSLNISARDAILPVVPMFHVNAWGLAYICPMVGAKIVLPGPFLDGASVYNLMKAEKVTMAAGVPTVWLGLLQHMQQGKLMLPDCTRTVIGGAAAPRTMIEAFEKQFKIPVIHAWGMTETSPLGLICNMKPKHADMSEDQKLALKVKQGRSVFGVDISVVNEDGVEVPRDGKTPGNFRVRGPWIAGEYFKKNEPCVDKDGWFDTGDVVTVDGDGYVQITDRSKDLVKSGGEWISSIELENEAMAFPAVQEAAVIGIPHPKWDERPLLIVVLKANQTATAAEILAFLKPRVSKMWLPDDVAFVKELPHTATGKVLKTALRDQFKGYKLPTI